MTDPDTIIDAAPLQDRDLLQRMSQYFDGVEQRLRNGEGWLIFNARAGRSRRIATFIEAQLASRRPPIPYLLMPWRDFALSAYVTEVGLAELAPEAGASAVVRREFEIAARVTADTWAAVNDIDLLVIDGLTPRHLHEAAVLERTLARRQAGRRATIVLTPGTPHRLPVEVGQDAWTGSWERVFGRMYERSLVAV
ncbi:MAG: hypothetical protein ACKOWF_14355 [Chloroflexota bacterium]